MSALPASDGQSRGVEGQLDLGLALVLGAAALALACSLYYLGVAETGAMSTWLAVLLAGAGVAAAAGAFASRRTMRPSRSVGEPLSAPRGEASAAGSPASPQQQELGLTPSLDEVGNLMDSFSRMLSTIERQAQEIDRYALRLDSAYKEIETSSAQLKEFSFKDEVTGLYNRRFFSIRLEEEVSRYRRFNHPVAVVLLDLDGFKEINDELGHAAGDETLRGMAEILLKYSRGINVICRYGGDEFAVLLVETSKGGARLYADRIRYVLPGFHFAHGRRVTASFGIASLPEDVTPAPDALIRAADEALYAAKRAGKNRVSVYEDIRALEPRAGPPAP
jgi:diguanylate cyclase (GGDEF)-like protein